MVVRPSVLASPRSLQSPAVAAAPVPVLPYHVCGPIPALSGCCCMMEWPPESVADAAHRMPAEWKRTALEGVTQGRRQCVQGRSKRSASLFATSVLQGLLEGGNCLDEVGARAAKDAAGQQTPVPYLPRRKLARAGHPYGFVVGPSCTAQGDHYADPGEEAALCVSGRFSWSNIPDALCQSSRRDLAGDNQIGGMDGRNGMEWNGRNGSGSNGQGRNRIE